MKKLGGFEPSRRTMLIGLGAAGLHVATALSAHSQSAYPNKPIRMIVPLPPGNSADTLARLIAERMTREIGQTVIVDNRPGATSIIGTQIAATAPADGYTLLYAIAGSMSINPHVFRNLPYKVSDFVPISHLLDVPFILSVRADSPYGSVEELFAAAKAKPDTMTYASYGEGSPTHLVMLQMLQAAGATMTHVPYKDGGLNDVLSGQVNCSVEATSLAIPQITAGKLRPLVVSARERLEQLPSVRTIQEANLGAPLYSWNGVFARTGTPPEIIARLVSVVQGIASSADFQKRVRDMAQVPRVGTPAEFAAFLKEDSENWGRVVARANVRLD